MSSISGNPLGRIGILIFLTAAVLSIHPSSAVAEIWGVKTHEPFSEPPSTLFRFDADGQSFTVVGIVTLDGLQVDVDGLASFPNPFNPRTTLSFSLPEEQVVQVTVHDLAGRHVRTLHQGRLPVGEQRLTWEGTGAAGRVMPAGVYFVRVTGTDWGRSTKVLLLP